VESISIVNTRILRSILGAALIAVAAFVIGSSAGNVSAAAAGQPVYGYLQTQAVAPGQTQGTITQGDLLNGATQDQITVTASTSTVTTYTATFQDTTKNGTLVLQDNGQSFSDGTFVEYGTVDGKASTGRFFGATGSITFNGSTSDGVHFTATISGEIRN
jgi:hypothetical protein